MLVQQTTFLLIYNCHVIFLQIYYKNTSEPGEFCLPCGCGRLLQRYCWGWPERHRAEKWKVSWEKCNNHNYFFLYTFSTLSVCRRSSTWGSGLKSWCVFLPLLCIFPGPPHHRFCSTPSVPVCPAAAAYTAPPPAATEGWVCQRDNGGGVDGGAGGINELSPHILARPVGPLHADLCQSSRLGRSRPVL